MVGHNLKGVLGVGDKNSNHSSSSLQIAEQNRIFDLEILVQHLQYRLRSCHGEDLRASLFS